MLIRQAARRTSGNGVRRVAANALRRLSSSREPESGTTSSGNLTALSAALLAAGVGWDYSNDFRFTRAAYLYASDNIVMPLMRLLDAESAHNVSIKATAWGLSPCDLTPNDPILQTQVLGLTFPNAIGLAAGYDKNAEAVNGLLDMGFGFIEIGTVTPEPQPGNDKPRMFRLVEDKAVINRCGFNNHGAVAVAERLKARAEAQQGPAKGFLGVNVGKNKWVAEDKAADDYCAAIKALAPYGDFVVVNVSSPNTPGLRLLQRREAIASLIERAADARDQVQVQTKKATLPLLVKIAPDLTEQEKADIAAVALSSRVDGLIVSNTTIARPAGLRSNFKGETGGLSGAPLRDASTAIIADMYRLTGGKVPLIGVGGVGTGQDAYDKIRAGASLVQIYSMMVYNGAGCVQRVKKELAALLRKNGYASVAEAVGAAHREKK